ncbi:hypothetical protein CLAFUW4_08310 [Fulvia fulva]|uniref:Uncharacterized protein n=1 Tax=Passalora fulva TaxID=5499 RepID=A0A9Q8LDW9_PASFU|nr:uncharacterized protein CLAFUR5_08418 [Fulvia fulva]KAK4629645.1 hypothetical protein CLAFUR4_08315 [Fulvia fulva]KAK4630260.1 hypothetical protein CLAFUR0_08310 [Fulvia fulva]UJO15595.1 hypothetical protein CLAFUR5_08418 [Fulvia fulva]WPV12622.1 hypothetical protein CLAFUW4_08310 [Fulvia fulva]WPV27398.1 hypothetical protein CLAFUW7_08310 [Fulvia fulva]
MDKSPLGSLAPELRNRIYELVLAQDQPVYIIQTSRAYGKYKQDPHRSRRLEIAITQTCRLLRQESTKMFYGFNLFTFAGPGQTAFGNPLNVALGFLESIGEVNAFAVREIHIESHRRTPVYAGPPHPRSEESAEEAKNQLDIASRGADRICQMAPACHVLVDLSFHAGALSFHLPTRSASMERYIKEVLALFVEMAPGVWPSGAVTVTQQIIDAQWNAR